MRETREIGSSYRGLEKGEDKMMLKKEISREEEEDNDRLGREKIFCLGFLFPFPIETTTKGVLFRANPFQFIPKTGFGPGLFWPNPSF